MAFLGSFGKLLGKGLKGASQLAGLVPGVGTVVGAGMGGLGELFEKGSKTNLGGFMGSAGKGAIGGALSGLGGIGGMGGGSGNILQQALGFAKGNPELVLGGLDAVLGARKGAESDKYRQQAIKQMQGQDKTRADLLSRALGMQSSNPDLSAMFADPSNPFAMQGGGPGQLPSGGVTPVDASGVKGFGNEAQARKRLEELGFSSPTSTLGRALGKRKKKIPGDREGRRVM